PVHTPGGSERRLPSIRCRVPRGVYRRAVTVQIEELQMTITDRSPSPATIGADELVGMRTADPAVRVIDVRSPGEFETGHIEGSYNVPLDLLDEHISDLAALDHDVVLVCQSGARATKALEQLVAAGKSNLRLLEGGITAWNASGGHVAR